MSTRFLTGKIANAAYSPLIWAAYDPNALCSAPIVADRRFPTFLAPHADEAAARAALVDAGCDPASIAEEVRPKRRGR
jgi:hypothetical protein